MITAKMKRPVVTVQVNAFGTLALNLTVDMVGTDDWQNLILLVLESAACEPINVKETIEEAMYSETGESYFHDHMERLVTIAFSEGAKS